MSRLGNLTGRLYRGEVSIDFVNRQKLWYTISGFILLISILALIFRGLDYSVEFKGGSQWTVPATAQVTQAKLEQIVTSGGGVNASATEVKPFNGKVVDGTRAFWQVQSGQLPNAKALAIGTQDRQGLQDCRSTMCQSRRSGQAGAHRSPRRRSRR